MNGSFPYRDSFIDVQENEDQSMFQAKLFPILHATDSIGLEDLLWIQGAVPDEDRTRFKRYRIL